MDASILTIPLWGAISVGAIIVTSIIGVVVWAFTFFATKEQHEEHEDRIRQIEQSWSDIRSDLSYIRGRLEP